jgi:hypothetical protein
MARIMSIDLASVTRAQAVVLAGGMSDVAAPEALAERRGQMPGSGGICVVAMGGAASASRFLDLLGPHGIGARVAGLCDDGAEGCFRRAVERAGPGSGVSRAGMEALGFCVCTADLEDELIRAAGHAAAGQIIQAHGAPRSLRLTRCALVISGWGVRGGDLPRIWRDEARQPGHAPLVHRVLLLDGLVAYRRQRQFHRFLRPLDLTVDKRHGQFHGRGESSLLFLEQPAHVFHVLHCLLGGIHCRRPFPIMCLLPT